ncbi:abortive infection family protein [Glutamicibacter sp. MNS18]|uniref:abortive infection family protein n=1 Tax=Glutamicibacter sp. MNS18 TaxID=2989817 RepID=UPI002235ECE6|nr:abortive infection family protein [Glutamicibacter sp. MNS18]MCW4467268.1 abortive infection family protein [Glutamicibacter sp. MNS18]
MSLAKNEVLQLVNRYIGVESGYLGDFSYRTHTDFYPEYCGIYDIFPDEIEGTTRGRFIAILTAESPDRQAKILRGVLERFPPNTDARQQFKSTIDTWIQQLEGTPVVASPMPIASMSTVVKQALIDAENLIRTSGPASAVDRVHTALHGHMNELCVHANIALPERPTLQVAVKKLRENHPGLAPSGQRTDEISRVLYSMAATLDALTTLRNNASPAHPNEALLGDNEALLAINAARTIFAYIDSKVRS